MEKICLFFVCIEYISLREMIPVTYFRDLYHFSIRLFYIHTQKKSCMYHFIQRLIYACLMRVTSFVCILVTPVRLVDGPHPFAGRLEVFFQGEWGSVCASYFDNDDADVVCGMIRNSSRGLV